MPFCEHPVRERAAERVARAEPADDVDLDARHGHATLDGERARALESALHHDDLRAEREQRGRRARRIALTGRHLDLVDVADDDVRAARRLHRPSRRILTSRPARRTMIEIADTHATGA